MQNVLTLLPTRKIVTLASISLKQWNCCSHTVQCLYLPDLLFHIFQNGSNICTLTSVFMSSPDNAMTMLNGQNRCCFHNKEHRLWIDKTFRFDNAFKEIFWLTSNLNTKQHCHSSKLFPGSPPLSSSSSPYIPTWNKCARSGKWVTGGVASNS